jgi:hypothetical protein
MPFRSGIVRRVKRLVRTAAALLAVVLTAAGCGFVTAMAHPEEQTTEASSPAPVAPAPTTPDPDEPVVIVNVPLTSGGSEVGRLVVTTGSVHTGFALPYPEMNDGCHLDGAALQYVPVTFTFHGGADDGGWAAHLTVTPGPATPGDIGDVGVFFRPTQGHDIYCRDSPPLPTTDTFWIRDGKQTSGWVVLEGAVTPATPQGRADVFLTLQARIDHIRLRDGDDERPLTPAAGPVGTPCADDAEALCVPLR